MDALGLGPPKVDVQTILRRRGGRSGAAAAAGGEGDTAEGGRGEAEAEDGAEAEGGSAAGVHGVNAEIETNAFRTLFSTVDWARWRGVGVWGAWARE